MELLRVKVKKEISRNALEKQIAEAIDIAERTCGKAKVRIHAAYLAAHNVAIIDISKDVGEFIAERFIELLTELYGETSFETEKIRNESNLGIKENL